MRRVLLADDEPLLHQALARNLRRRRPDWVLEFAGTGAEAVERSVSTRFDAVVLDQRMPGISGIEAACEIRWQCADAACVMLTGFADLATVIAAINDAGIVRFLSKPCPTEVLIGAIETAFAQHDRMLPQVAASRGGEESPLRALALERLPFAALPAAESLMAFFELTAAEARLVHALIRGLTLQEASVEQALTLSSARTNLRHVFGKLGVTRQAELMRRVLTSPVMFVDDAPQMRRAVTSAS